METNTADTKLRKGPPSVQALERRAEAYFDACDQAARRYTRPGLLVALGITEDTARTWLGQHGERADLLRRGLLRVMDDLEQRDDAKSLFLLKQPCYGGYRDKPEENVSKGGGALEVRVCFRGEDYGA